MPLFVTALMVPFWVVVLRVIRSTDGEDRRLTASEATKFVSSSSILSIQPPTNGSATLKIHFRTNVLTNYNVTIGRIHISSRSK